MNIAQLYNEQRNSVLMIAFIGSLILIFFWSKFRERTNLGLFQKYLVADGWTIIPLYSRLTIFGFRPTRETESLLLVKGIQRGGNKTLVLAEKSISDITLATILDRKSNDASESLPTYLTLGKYELTLRINVPDEKWAGISSILATLDKQKIRFTSVAVAHMIFSNRRIAFSEFWIKSHKKIYDKFMTSWDQKNPS